MFKLSDSVVLKIGALHRLIQRNLKEELIDITPAQYLILSLIDKNKKTYITDINALYFGERTTISRAVSQLEKLGYVAISREGNYKFRISQITEEGKKVLERNNYTFEAYEEMFDESERKMLDKLIKIESEKWKK